MEIILDKVNYYYEDNSNRREYALKNISLSINKGERVGIIGHTGSGKSTLIQHLNGLIKAKSGKIYYKGQDIYDKDFNMTDLRTKVGVVFQYPEHQLFETNVYKDVFFGPSRQNITRVEAQKRAYEALDLVGISGELYDVSPFDLSGGEKRRVAIAGIIAMAPEVLVLDEPTAGLDPKTKSDLLNVFKKLNEEAGMTIIMATHCMEEIAEYVDRVIVMDKGKIVYDDIPEVVFSHRKELEEMGLAVPQVTQVLDDLAQSGYGFYNTVTTLEQAERILLAKFNDRI